MCISQAQHRIKISDMRFAAERVFSLSAIKAELNFDPMLTLRDSIYQLK